MLDILRASSNENLYISKKNKKTREKFVKEFRSSDIEFWEKIIQIKVFSFF